MSRAVGVALAEIRKVTPAVTPEEIQRRARNYPTHFSDAALTAPALAKHWARCDRPAANGSPSGRLAEVRREIAWMKAAGMREKQAPGFAEELRRLEAEVQTREGTS
jgi:hypothetical protein